MTATYQSLQAIDAQLAAGGHHGLTPFWADAAERLYSHPTARDLVARVGRGGAKSFTSAKFACNEVLAGTWAVPPGERHYFAFVSRLKDEVSQRRILLESFLRTLRVPFDTSGDEIALRELPLGFRFFACSVAAVSGLRCIGYVADEVAKWESTDSYKNPASEVIASLNAMCITHPAARRLLVSSPWSTDDFHATRFDLGNTTSQVVAFAPSWVANPGISEADTHAAEPDPKIHQREYGAEPSHTVSAALDALDVAGCFDREPPQCDEPVPFVAIDASSLRGDAFAYIAGHITPESEVVVDLVSGWEHDKLRRVSMHEIVATIARESKGRGVYTIFGDQREEAALAALFEEHELRLQSLAWTEPSKDAAVMLLRRAMRERKVFLCEHATLRRELTGMKARLMPSGRTSYATNGLDYASALITLAHAMVDGAISANRGDTITVDDPIEGEESRWGANHQGGY